ncbi:hypothetical protein TNIN_225531 [Trichonephila inaurata madagascariensis]|uniref:Uncharacterized protein n=1 Tax=Trichonephila inaurata madagascariensis TaxID=2747483 RepID=A0A8X6YQ42_9ARAC|nr:hypothetical protein TNIN_225531 [Trichonephila inaurata madagascariensis]
MIHFLIELRRVTKREFCTTINNDPFCSEDGGALFFQLVLSGCLLFILLHHSWRSKSIDGVEDVKEICLLLLPCDCSPLVVCALA